MQNDAKRRKTMKIRPLRPLFDLFQASRRENEEGKRTVPPPHQVRDELPKLLRNLEQDLGVHFT